VTAAIAGRRGRLRGGLVASRSETASGTRGGGDVQMADESELGAKERRGVAAGGGSRAPLPRDGC
jgi:hypothetical protein